MPFTPPDPDTLVADEKPAFTPPSPNSLIDPTVFKGEMPKGTAEEAKAFLDKPWYEQAKEAHDKDRSTKEYAESLIGLDPSDIPSGANTTMPGITVPLSAIGKTAAGVGQFMTSPKGITEMAATATPAAPAIYATWAYDMLKGGAQSAVHLKDTLVQMIYEHIGDAIVKGNASNLGIPISSDPDKHNEQIQSMADDAINIAASALGTAGAVHGAVHSGAETAALLSASEKAKAVAPMTAAVVEGQAVEGMKKAVTPEPFTPPSPTEAKPEFKPPDPKSELAQSSTTPEAKATDVTAEVTPEKTEAETPAKPETEKPIEPKVEEAATPAKPTHETLTPAIVTEDGQTHTGPDHATIRSNAAKEGIDAFTNAKEGFINEVGKFVPRDEGAKWFKDKTGKDTGVANELHSEDLKAEGLLSHLDEEKPAAPSASVVEEPLPAPPETQPETGEPPPPKKPATTSAPAESISPPPPAPENQIPPSVQKKGFDSKQAKAQKKFLLTEIDKAVEEAPETVRGEWIDPTLKEEHLRVAEAEQSKPFEKAYGKTKEEAAADVQAWTEKHASAFEDLFTKYGIPTESPQSTPYKNLMGETEIHQKGGPLSLPERLSLLDEAVEKSNMGLRDMVTIEVPGDGVFNIVNDKQSLKEFREKAESFPTTAPKVKKPGMSRATPTAAAPLGKPDKEGITKALALGVGDDPTRPILHNLWSDGKDTISTNGRALIRVKKGIGGTPKNPIIQTPDGKRAAAGVKFPDWKQVVPTDPPIVAKDLDTGRLFTVLRQAQEATSEKQNAVKLWKNKDGSIGVSASSPDTASYSHNVHEDADLIASIDPKYLIASVNAARLIGDEKISLHSQDELSPIVLRGKNSESVIMPMRESGGEVVRPPTTEPPTPKQGEAPLAFGGGTTRASPAPAPEPESVPVAKSVPELEAIQKAVTPGLDILNNIKEGIQSLLLPSSKSPEHLTEAERLGSKLGPMNQRAEAAASQLRPHSKIFDRLGVHNEALHPNDNPGIRFMSDMSQGRPMEGKFKVAADLIKKLFNERLEKLEAAGAELQTVRENYFPGMWTKESRSAFNAAMEQAVKEGIIKEGFDVNDATPEQKAWVKERVDKFLGDGTTSDKDMLPYLTRRPMKGQESFRKQKVFDDIMTGAEFGLKPISNNPIDLIKGKLAEMDKSIMANEYFQDLKKDGKLKIVNPYEEVPDGWVKINDKYGTIYGPPTVKIPEYIDKKVYEGLLAAAEKLGVSHERLMRFPPGKGNRALGLSYQGQNKILSRFGTETSVIAHELGHQLDVKYNLWNNLLRTESGKGFQPGRSELRNIADLTERGRNARSKEEKIAQMLEAYVHSPEKMQEVAPRVFEWFDSFIKSKPELAGIAEIKPGIALTKLTGDKYVGLPILGYRTVPVEAGDIINNYLSSSLYNNQYFGTLYKGWMSTANALNQSQLGFGSAFHAGFTTGEAQVSANANVIKDVYGVLRGNRKVSDLVETTAKATVGSIRTAVVGDRVLNAWREKDGQIDPRIAQVVRATELAGGGYKMESGLRTEQAAKTYRDWFSNHRIRAALRSPIAATELMAKPIMDYLVPRQKAGVFADLAWRIIEQNPGKPLEELTPQFRQAWNRVDARLGQVRYNRLFANNTAKNVVQGLVRAPGWSGGTLAELGGAFTDAGKMLSDWVTTGKLPENIPDRTAYAISLLATIGAANAALTYAFTGTAPTGLDYFAFRTGKKDEQGNDERFLLPSYMKDVLAYAKAPGKTLLNKTHPLISMLNEVFVKNQDYYGVEIRSPDSSLPEQAGQTAKYVVKSFEPFWTRGVRKESERGVGAVRTAAPFVGIMPAPPSISRTPAESLAVELMRAQLPQGSRTKEQFERSQKEQQATIGIRRGSMTIEDAQDKGLVTDQRASAVQKRAETPYLEYAISRLSATAAVRVFEKASEKERNRIADLIDGKIDRTRSLSDESKEKLRERFEKAQIKR